MLLTDTVGFISKLPTDLIAAFRATLEEVHEPSSYLGPYLGPYLRPYLSHRRLPRHPGGGAPAITLSNRLARYHAIHPTHCSALGFAL